MSPYQKFKALSGAEREREMARFDQPLSEDQLAAMPYAPLKSQDPVELNALRVKVLRAHLAKLLAQLDTAEDLGRIDHELARRTSEYLAELARSA